MKILLLEWYLGNQLLLKVDNNSIFAFKYRIKFEIWYFEYRIKLINSTPLKKVLSFVSKHLQPHWICFLERVCLLYHQFHKIRALQ